MARKLMYATLTMVLTILAVIIATVLAPLSWAKDTSGGLIGESLISSSQDAIEYASSGVQEAEGIWAEDPINWEVMHNDSGLIVEARCITEGPFSSSGVLLTRSRATIGVDSLGHGNHTADSVFAFLVSPEGFGVIDPISDPEEFTKYVEKYSGWKEGEKLSRLEVAEAYAPLPQPFSERIFVVLNAVASKERVMISKSVLHRDRPGASIYYTGSEFFGTDDTQTHNKVKQVRALNTFGVRVTDITRNPKQGRLVQVEMINWADIGFHSSIMNWINCVPFFPGVFERLSKALNS